jgi:hypothetical protein
MPIIIVTGHLVTIDTLIYALLPLHALSFILRINAIHDSKTVIMCTQRWIQIISEFKMNMHV